MKKILSIAVVLLLCYSCNQPASDTTVQTENPEEQKPSGGQERVSDDVSAKDIVKVAVASKDHTTLVAALKQADLVTSLSNAGPFTVFAPTDEAFSKLPAGTVDDLMKNENKEKLQTILQYHVTLSAMKIESFKDGQTLGMVDGTNATIHIKDGKTMINDAVIIASVSASNGMIHVIDKVLLPSSN